MTLATQERAIWLARNALPHEPALRAWLSRRPLAGLEVDDIVQETYAILAALEAVDHIQTPRTYMFEVAKSVILRSLRRSRIVAFEALAEAEALVPPSAEPSPETVAADRQELSRIAALIAGLPTKCREAFTLRKVHGLSQREVAQRMGVSENTVEKHVGKGIGVLMKAMGRGGNGRFQASKDRSSEDPIEVDHDPREQRRH
ncbi:MULTISPECIES: RNA polymerase sigma factor [Caulobacter]|jgi:RNA polymerase sigma factor (sigma-70 family)|uniref:RNA polymerase sigma factor, sigma-70 family n=1 Tax=Caulobacter vibrioides OR37 TaxID=1292034 RepID=R0E963_CAUVI|nr:MULTISPECIES: RNA polymerase sigma factor [Caulobacter]ENZ82023.1 RNA polymerase sigma factor, sigma-70 family [Caulobacter vibrioides OR37]MBQ1560962.1 RNA polymerase sigma factor [Caulobacter sp.]